MRISRNLIYQVVSLWWSDKSYYDSFRDLSNNTFHQSEAPAWFSTLQSLTTLWVLISYEYNYEFPQTMTYLSRNKWCAAQSHWVWFTPGISATEAFHFTPITTSVSIMILTEYSMCYYPQLIGWNDLNTFSASWETMHLMTRWIWVASLVSNLHLLICKTMRFPQ